MVGLNLLTAIDQIKEEMNSRTSTDDKTIDKQGLMGSTSEGNDKPNPFSVILDSLSKLKEKREITQKELSRYQSPRPMSFAGAAVPEITDEDLRKFQKDARIKPMNFSRSIIKERDFVESDIMKDVRADAAEKLAEEKPAIEQDQVEQQDTSTLKGNEVGLMAKPVQDTTEEVEEDTTTPTRDELIDSVFDAEGGYSTDRNDTGNYYQNQFIGTNHGISAPVLAEYLGRTPTVQDMRDLSEDTAREIAATQYYDRYNIADLPNETQEIVFHAVYMGGSRGVRAVQNLTGSTPDGIMGPNTRQAMRDSTFTPQEFRDEYLRELEFGTQGYSDPSATWDDHGRGWTNRYNDLAGD
jgi:hypothetical protein